VSAKQVAIVTGAAGGIGEAITRRLGQDGMAVIGTGRTEASLAKLKEGLAGEMEFDFVAGDLAGDEGPARVVAAAVEKFGRLDHVINNAGSFNFGPVGDTTDEMLDEVLGISLRAPFRLCREALPHLGEGASILFIGSTWGLYGTAGGGAYSAVKAGQIGLMQTLTAEYGRRGIRANYIAPTVVRTAMTDAYWDEEFFHRTNHELTPLARECTTDDVAEMVSFLCSDRASFVTGQTIAVDGGVSSTRYLDPKAIMAERK